MLSNGDLPEGFWAWFFGTIGVVVGTLATTVAALFKINETKNEKSIAGQAKEIATFQTDLKFVRENLSTVETARLECERDRASLTAKCEIFEARLSRLEQQA
jgi:septal ring factor EnvC (AmiA/AmiB activator)